MDRASGNTINDICRERFDKIASDEKSVNSNEFMAHFGPLTQELVNSISSEIEERLFESGIKKGIVKRVFSIMVEGLQNIRLHGEKDQDDYQHSFFSIHETEDQYHIYLGNLVFNENVEKIQNRIDQVNGLTKEEIKQLYLDVLTNGIISSKGGAGLGFITMSMKSQNPLDGTFVKIDDEISHYDLRIAVDKVKKK